MNAQEKSFARRASMTAVQMAVATLLVCLCNARAADSVAAEGSALDPAVAALVQRSSTVEIGVGATSDKSAKANEYTGLTGKGAYLIGSFDLRSGAAYDSEDPTRWRITGLRLGTEAREISGEYSVQGRYKLTFGYDELLRNRSDSYQTPLLGAGSNVLTLPSSWVVPIVPRVSGTSANARGLSPDVTNSSALISGVLTAPTAAQLATAASLQAADLPAFQHVDLHTKRTRYSLGAVTELTTGWQASASYSHEDKVGLKPMGTVTAVTGGDISTAIPDLIDQSTEQFNLGIQYHDRKLLVQAAYYGSIFVNNVPSMSWSNWALPSSTQTMSSAPSNQFHQFNLNASYAISPTTRFTGAASYGRNIQNDTFLTSSYTPLVPVTSLNGEVVSKSLSLRLGSRPMPGLNLSAAYKFDDRDNRTAIHTYGYYDAGAAKSGTSAFSTYYPGLGSNANLNANRPYSKKQNQLNLDADLQVAQGQSVKAGYEYQDINRYCNGSWVSCVDADHSKENSFKLEWRANAWETLNTRLGYVRSVRTVDYNEDAWLAIVPAAGLTPTGAPAGSSVYSTMLANGWTGYGPISGLNPLPTPGSAAAFFFANNNAASNALYANQNRISELPGMRRYNMADRTRDKVRASLDWQASEQFTLQLGVDFNQDDYSHSVYGLQKGSSQAFNLDGSYAVNESISLSAYASHEELRGQSAGNSYTANSTAANVNGFTAISGGCYSTIALRNANNKIDQCLNWSNDMRDKVDTVGAAYTHKGLVSGKLDLNAGLSYSRARSTNDVAGGNYANNPLAVAGAPAGTVAAYYIAAQALPVVTTTTWDLNLSGKYALDKNAALRLGYRYQYMKSNDWSYDGMQPGGLSGVLPSYEQAPNFKVQTLSVAYLYSFR